MYKDSILILLLVGTSLGAHELPFVIVIASYNNSKWCEKNIRSAINQNYQNYRIVYIDDASTDATHRKVKNYLNLYDNNKRCSLIGNKSNQGALCNYYRAIHQCEDNEIIVTLDGDDWLAHENVLAELNKIYQNQNVWLTYGQYRCSDGRLGHCRSYSCDVIRNNSFRSSKWLASHLRSFYAGLFKKIKKEDLFYDGEFFSMAWDLAFMIPMLEMAGVNHKFIDQVLYVYNVRNVRSDFRKDRDKQQFFHEYSMSKNSYKKRSSFR